MGEIFSKILTPFALASILFAQAMYGSVMLPMQNTPTQNSITESNQPQEKPTNISFDKDSSPKEVQNDEKYFDVWLTQKPHTLLASAHPILQLNDIDLASFSTVAHTQSSLFDSPFDSGYSALFTKISLNTPAVYGFYMGTTFSALARIADFSSQRFSFEDPRIYSLLINNDEAKDTFFVSEYAHLSALFLGYENEQGNFGAKIGRYEGDYEWIGDYLEGAEAYGVYRDMRLAFGGFYRQSYANPSENTRYGYLKQLYERYEGYHITMNFYADANYQAESWGMRIYANYFASLYAATGISYRYDKQWNKMYFGALGHLTFVSAGTQEAAFCTNPNIAEAVGLSCYQQGSFGKRNGGVLHLEGRVGYGLFRLFAGFVGNDKNRATDLLPIYSDNNPLEYNTYIYGEGGQSGYIKIDYRGIKLGKIAELGGFIGYGRTMFFAPDKHFSNQAVGEIELDFKRIKWHLTIVYLDEVRYSKTLITKLLIGYKF